MYVYPVYICIYALLFCRHTFSFTRPSSFLAYTHPAICDICDIAFQWTVSNPWANFCHIKCEICYSYYKMFNSYHLRHLSLWVCFCWILNIQLCPQMPFNLLTITHNSTERGDKEIVTFKLLYTQNKSLTSHDMKRNYFWCLQQ